MKKLFAVLCLAALLLPPVSALAACPCTGEMECWCGGKYNGLDCPCKPTAPPQTATPLPEKDPAPGGRFDPTPEPVRTPGGWKTLEPMTDLRRATPSPDPSRETVDVQVTFVLPDGTIVSSAAFPARPAKEWINRATGKPDPQRLQVEIGHAELNAALPEGYEVDPFQPDPIEITVPRGEASVSVAVVVRKAAQNDVIAFSPAALPTFAPDDAAPVYLFDSMNNLIAVISPDDPGAGLPAGFARTDRTCVRDEANQQGVLNAMKYTVDPDGGYELAGMKFLAGGHLILPYNTAAVKAGAFADNPMIVSAVIVNTVRIIEAGAFRNCPRLETVILPADVGIGEGAFDGISESAVFYVPENSASQRWCAENGLSFVPYTNEGAGQ